VNFQSDNQKYGILSACFGSIPMVMIQDSAIIILFATLLGCSDMIMMLTTAAPGIMNCLLIIPGAFIAAKFGYKKIISLTSWYGTIMLLLLASSPFFGLFDKYVLLFAVFAFCVSVAIYFSAWVPLMENFLQPETRSEFLGRKRFFWRLTSFLFFLISAAVIGKKPPLWKLQSIIVIAAMALPVRAFYINKIKVKEKKSKLLSIRTNLIMSVSNKPLISFSIYLAFLYLAANSTIPLAFIFLKKHSSTPDNIIVMISSLIVGGALLGFLCSGWSFRRLSNKKILLSTHVAFALINILLFFISANTDFMLILMSSLLTIYGFFYACASVVLGAEIMALANPDNKAVDIAFASMMYSIGIGGSRALTSAILGSGILAQKWQLGTMHFTMYHTMFLGYGVAVIIATILLAIVPMMFSSSDRKYTKVLSKQTIHS